MYFLAYGVGVAKTPGKARFHAPFEKLKERADSTMPPPREAPPSAPPAREESDDELWRTAVEGVERLSPWPGLAGPPPPVPSGEDFWHPDLDAIRALEALVSGEAPFDLADTDEYIEGRVADLDAGIVRRLRRGEFAVQGHIDLHGMTRGEAKAAVEGFLKRSRRSGKRCVLLVHGRGIHSREKVPVLKDALKNWLATARFGRHVLAFATARPADGGAGALYVLLRRAGR
ncbi:MAG TPA: Smr/MutS family protein [Anaeromyxobacteraceae bacterium]|nr:Smr/MutS family protein [Anaeromyxobacteraceae bacterium]